MINDHDMVIIKQIEEQLWIKLNPLPLEEIWGKNGYALDKKTG